MTDILATLAMLRPFDAVNRRKVRLGSEGDGGYVMIDRFRPGQMLFSFGVGDNVSFDFDAAERGVKPLLFDHTIETLPDAHTWCQFHRIGLGAVADDRLPVDTLHALVDVHAGQTRNDLLLKLDVEGAEWTSLDVTPEDVLARFEQIVVEWHWLQWLREQSGADRIDRVWRKLAQNFRPVHVHGHNHFDFVTTGGLPIPPILEVTYARDDLFSLVPSKQRFPVAGLDFPCDPDRPEHLLWFWPFMPD